MVRDIDDAQDLLRQEISQKVDKMIDEKFPTEKAPIIKAFVQHFYNNVATDDLITRDSENLFGAAISMWNLAQVRQSGEITARIYNPRLESDGWHSSHTVIQVVNDDMPFLVDSLIMMLNEHSISPHIVVHPIFKVERDAKHHLLQIQEKAPKKAKKESYILIEIDEQANGEALESFKKILGTVLKDVRRTVQDWSAMRGVLSEIQENFKTVKGIISPEDIKEATDFVAWLDDDHYTFMGYRQTSFDLVDSKARINIDSEHALGILRDPEREVFKGLRDLSTQPPEVYEALVQPVLVRIIKSSHLSTVHRSSYLDTVAIKIFNKKGQPIGEHLFVGLFTSGVDSKELMEIPLLRHKIKYVQNCFDFEQKSHSAKNLMYVLNGLPRDELFQSGRQELVRLCRGIMSLVECPRIRLFLRQDLYRRFFNVFVYLPQELYTTELRQKIMVVLEKGLNGHVRHYSSVMGEDTLSRIRFSVWTDPTHIPDIDISELEEQIIDVSRSWNDRLREVIIDNLGEEQGLILFHKYSRAFPQSYKDRFSVYSVVHDIVKLEEVLKDKGLRVSLYRPVEKTEDSLRFKIYHYGGPIVLSHAMPMLENMGLRVMEEHPFGTYPLGSSCAYIHDFALETIDGRNVDLASIREKFHEAFLNIWNEKVEDDGFNKLVVASSLGSREVVILRAFSQYLRQARLPFSSDYMEETLVRNSKAAALLIKLFLARFNPRLSATQRKAQQKDITASLEKYLGNVLNLEEDRILRYFLNLIEATLRTNFFQLNEDGKHKPYLSLKFDAHAVLVLPKPRPLREIFVYSPRFEAVHLRFGLVARGGLRWSDRRDDFRTEILGLVKAQQVKNSVIVPVGSKGGFVLKKAPHPSQREAFKKEGIACYKLFISGLLDVTDNLVDNKVVAPTCVVRQDGDDPYLVVAADKGTATFSDYANGVSKSYNFWLGDAFASGGSAGYDHKKMGITARGAWESVKRHFREMGHDTQKEDFTVAGIGDMAGDVFGNGMLLSKHIRLVGAFNHMHIFLDPNPVAKTSFVERQRLFDNPSLTWADYDKSLISQGGGIFDRSAKSIKLSPQIKEMLHVTEDKLTPNQLMHEILRARVDLFWFGGIGTYVKHSKDDDVTVGDRANDGIRVNANQLHCKVIGEGANLGMTQRARIEFSLLGGRCYTDAIDNSAGVDTSDHEVNIKILLNERVNRGDMTEKQRNVILGGMTDDISKLVLRDNYQQIQSISVMESQAGNQLDIHQRLIRSLERAGHLDRALEFLPDDEEIDSRFKAGIGLTRPEIAIILAYAKNTTYQVLLKSDLPDALILQENLTRYFPQELQDKFLSYIKTHRLHREIVATAVTNSMINRSGAAFINEMRLRTGYGDDEIARAYSVTCAVFNLREIWHGIEALDYKVDVKNQVIMLTETRRTIMRMTEWFLRHGKSPIDIKAQVETYQIGVETVKNELKTILPKKAQKALKERMSRFEGPEVPEHLATQIGQLKMLSSLCDVVDIAQEFNTDIVATAKIYMKIGVRFDLDWLRTVANRIPTHDRWNRMALGAIGDDLWTLQSALTGHILKGFGVEGLKDWLEHNKRKIERIDQLLGELTKSVQQDLAMLTVAVRELRNLL